MKSCPLEGQEEKTIAGEEQMVVDEPWVEKVLVEDKDAKKIVDLGSGDLILDNLEDRDMVHNDPRVDDVISHENTLVLVSMDDNMEVVHYEGNFSFVGYSDGVLIPSEDQMNRGDIFVLFCVGVQRKCMVEPITVDAYELGLYFNDLILGSNFSSGVMFVAIFIFAGIHQMTHPN